MREKTYLQDSKLYYETERKLYLNAHSYVSGNGTILKFNIKDQIAAPDFASSNGPPGGKDWDTEFDRHDFERPQKAQPTAWDVQQSSPPDLWGGAYLSKPSARAASQRLPAVQEEAPLTMANVQGIY